jgi:hypothetical protein
MTVLMLLFVVGGLTINIAIGVKPVVNCHHHKGKRVWAMDTDHSLANIVLDLPKPHQMGQQHGWQLLREGGRWNGSSGE